MDKIIAGLMAVPTISIIMPAYNAGSFIGQAIESVQAQDDMHWQLVVINDGSTDDTGFIADQYAQSDPRIRVLHQANGRQGKARNKGLQQADGSLIAFLDADDYWHPAKLSLQRQALLETGADAVFADAWLQTGEANDTTLGSAHGWLPGAEALSSMLTQNRLPVLTVLIKKEWLSRVGGFSEDPHLQNAEDYHLWLRLLAAGCRFWGMEAPLASYRQHPGNATADYWKAFWPVCHCLQQLRITQPAPSAALFQKALQQKIGQFLTQASRLGDTDLRNGLAQLCLIGDDASPRWIPWMQAIQLPLGAQRKLLKLAYG
jgi:glycosyltransferase involved in cell wall biosynthesis